MKYRIREGHIIFELFEPPKDKDIKKGVIVFPGLPNQPRNEDFGENLSSEGFWVLQPRYIGSWESYGTFCMKDCIKTVIESEKLFLKGRTRELWGDKEISWDLEDIFLISSSFGSAVVLSALSQIKSKKIICLAPLTNLDKHNSEKNIEEQDLFELGLFIKRGFENAFRGFSLGEWKEFITGKTEINPIKYVSLVNNKRVLIVHGDADKVINISRSEEYYKAIGKKNKTDFKKYPGVGHGKEIKNASFDFILKWMKNN
jgi:hypothetical protein